LLKGFDLCAFACASNPPLEKLSLFPFQLWTYKYSNTQNIKYWHWMQINKYEKMKICAYQ
jgi:phage protein U